MLLGVVLDAHADKNLTLDVVNYSSSTDSMPNVIVTFAHAYSVGILQAWAWHAPMIRRIEKLGAVPFLKLTTHDWSPDSALGFSAASILSGGMDSYFADAARACDAASGPVYVSINHEMNGDWYPYSELYQAKRHDWTADNYILCYRHIVNVLRMVGKGNIRFAWAPDSYGRRKKTDPQTPSYVRFYPGDDYVDIIAPSHYNNVITNNLDDLMQRYPTKPLFLSEWGVSEEKIKWYPGDYPGDSEWINSVITWIKGNAIGGAWYQADSKFRIERSEEQVKKYRGLSGLGRMNYWVAIKGSNVTLDDILKKNSSAARLTKNSQQKIISGPASITFLRWILTTFNDAEINFRSGGMSKDQPLELIDSTWPSGWS